MNVIPALPILVPLLGALVALIGRRSLVWQKIGDFYILFDGGRFGATRCESGGWNGSLGLAYRRLGGTIWDHAGRRYVSGGVAIAKRGACSNGGGVCVWRPG